MKCKNANILGIPGKGIHRFRLGGVAIVDLLLTLLLALGFSYIPGSPPVTVWIIFLLLLSMVLHGFFCTKTSVNDWLYKNNINLTLFSGLLIVLATILIFLKNNY